MRPIFQGDLYGATAISDPYPAYRRIRDAGPAVWSPRRGLWLLGRFEDVRAALRADDILVSGRGVAANDLVNSAENPITLTSDGETHARRRLTLIQPVMPGPLKALRPRLEAEAEQLVAALSGLERFDAMSRFAAHLPVTVVAELVGLNAAGRKNMLRWAAATFDALGVMNARGIAAMPRVLDLGRYVRGLSRSSVTPGGWADRLFEAAERGDISQAEAQAMVIDYVGPALDTTILAVGEMVWRLATTPGAYDQVRADPALIPGVVNESVRIGSPLRGFTRLAAEAYPVGEVTIPQGERVLVLYASANRDERHYADPDRFDVTRNPRDHVGWGHGAHTCVGMHLARLEMEILLQALVRQVERIETGPAKRIRNNVLQGFKTLPTRFVRAAA
ncbi:cytochrome P450 [Phenylobacterium aquaticum]|uniref:cytochrome P450 n=1 Tax=Phenylobacterium aquaticum TaxID=1763816 RepID=UPI001F5D3CDA|nr:cytochrome P450 [Phenylobacterium aquaticum]MCI3133169.1 cytochrome P450 [Phenylobacterium aquaticum]